MKKLLMISILSVASTFAYAQSTKIGFKAGANFNHISTNGIDLKEEPHGRPSIHFGIVADFEMSKKISFQPQLLFSGRGAKESHGDHSDAYVFNSIEAPLNFVYKSNNEKGLFFGAGPAIGYNINGKKEGHDNGGHQHDDLFEPGVNQYKRFDLGVNALLGYQVSKKLFVSTNYNLGLTDWRNSNPSWRNNIAAVSIGYFFK
jgi:hypothetical protein